MSVYLVTYDLKSPGQKYEKVLERIKKHSWARLSESCYAISTNWTVNQVYDDLRTVMDKNDYVYIITLSYPYVGYGAEEVNDWLKQHLG